MANKRKSNRFWTGVPPWILIGAVMVLFPIFAFMTIQNITRQKESNFRLLLEKGAALIRSFEAGTRTGMGLSWSGLQLQKLLTETAQQRDIVYLLVTDTNGIVLAHNDPAHIGKKHGKGLDLRRISLAETIKGRIVSKSDGKKIFEVFRKFSPTQRGFSMGRGHMMMQMWFQQGINERINIPPSNPIIFVGLDMASIEEAIKSDTRHTVIMGIILLLIGFAGITLLFLAQSYRTARMSLSRIKAFSDNLVENMPIGLVAIDNNKKITSLNHVAGSILNLSAEKVIGENADQVVPAKLWQLLENLDMEKEKVLSKKRSTVRSGKTRLFLLK